MHIIWPGHQNDLPCSELVTYHITAVTSWDSPKEFRKCWLSLPPISPPLQWQRLHLGWVVALRFQGEDFSVWAIGSSHWNQCNVCARSRMEKFRTVVLFYFLKLLNKTATLDTVALTLELCTSTTAVCVLLFLAYALFMCLPLSLGSCVYVETTKRELCPVLSVQIW